MNTKNQPKPVAIGDQVEFIVNADGQEMFGTVVAVNVPTVNGVSTDGWVEPVHIVQETNAGLWAIHPSWIVNIVKNRYERAGRA